MQGDISVVEGHQIQRLNGSLQLFENICNSENNSLRETSPVLIEK